MQNNLAEKIRRKNIGVAKQHISANANKTNLQAKPARKNNN